MSGGSKVLEEDGMGKQVNKPSKSSWPWGAEVLWAPDTLEIRLRIFVVQRLIWNGLDGNVRSPEGCEENRNPSIFLFYQSFMNKSGLCAVPCYLFARFSILSFMFSPLPLCMILFCSLSLKLLLINIK